MSRDYIFTEDWFSSNIPTLYNFLFTYKASPCRILEIGCFQGRSTIWFLTNILLHEQSNITCVDPFTGSVEHTPEQVDHLFDIFSYNLRNYKHKTILFKGKSSDILRANNFTLDNVYDVVYIDGDHRAPAVMEDAVLSFACLRQGGLMIFDDYHGGDSKGLLSNDSTNFAVSSFIKVYAPFVDILSVNYQLILRKK